MEADNKFNIEQVLEFKNKISDAAFDLQVYDKPQLVFSLRQSGTRYYLEMEHEEYPSPELDRYNERVDEAKHPTGDDDSENEDEID